MTVKEIVREYLEAKGYDGLYNEDAGCACLKEELAPCCNMTSSCQPGYAWYQDPVEFDFLIRPTKEGGSLV